ncbi:thioredoxin family protein [Patescibacteria group bacterium]
MVLLESIDIPLGSDINSFTLKGADGNMYSLDNFDTASGIVIIFMCNHCPYVQAIWERLVILQDKYQEKGIQFIGVNPNLHPDYPEESLEKMKEYYDNYNMNFPYLQDDTQDLAREYQAQCTPDIFVYNQERKLFYHGRVDDNWQDEGQVTKNELDEALDMMLEGRGAPSQQYPCIGCSIKWK